MDVEGTFERLIGRTLEVRFTLDRVVARGGSGVVFRGTQLALGCPVAIKLLAVSEHEGHVSPRRFVEAFEREARIVATLRHPAVVRVIDSGVTDAAGEPRPFVVFEWIEGETLEAHLHARPGQRRSPREALALLRPVLEAIACAHEAGVVHRDLKPSNVMVASPDGGAILVRVLDFGVAKAIRPDDAPSDAGEYTTDEFAAYTLSHAAPEQVGRLRTGPWTDVHALALLLVELLVGERAYRGANTVELFSRITAHERPTPGAFGVDVGPWEPALRDALALDPKARQPDAAALLRDLAGSLDAAQRAWERPAAPAHTPTPAPVSATRRRAPVVALAAFVACAAVATWRLAGKHTPARSAAPHPVVGAPARPVALGSPRAIDARPAVAPAVTPAETPPAPMVAPPPVVRAAPRPTLARSASRRMPHERELAIE
jgi:serine/threonine protein kinase